MPVSIQIRRARREDRKRLGALWLQLLRRRAQIDPRFEVADDALERWRNDFPFWLADENRCLFVVEEAGELAGFAAAHRWTPPPIYAVSDEVSLNELYVLPEAQGQGLGTRLVEAVQAWAEDLGAHRMRVDVLAADEAGRAFWERQEARLLSLTYTVDLDPSTSSGKQPSQGRIGF